MRSHTTQGHVLRLLIHLTRAWLQTFYGGITGVFVTASHSHPSLKFACKPKSGVRYEGSTWVSSVLVHKYWTRL